MHSLFAAVYGLGFMHLGSLVALANSVHAWNQMKNVVTSFVFLFQQIYFYRDYFSPWYWDDIQIKKTIPSAVSGTKSHNPSYPVHKYKISAQCHVFIYREFCWRYIDRQFAYVCVCVTVYNVSHYQLQLIVSISKCKVKSTITWNDYVTISIELSIRFFFFSHSAILAIFCCVFDLCSQ